MKNNKLEFKDCWFVNSWATEYEKGKGVEVVEGGFFESDRVLFYNTDKKTYDFKSGCRCYWSLESANKALLNSKIAYLAYLKEEQIKRAKKIKELENG